MTLRRYAIEEAYELLDAIEAGDDREIADELGDVLLQVVFHSQMAAERGAFDFDTVCRGQENSMAIFGAGAAASRGICGTRIFCRHDGHRPF